jgi:hypothetical protein
MEAYAACFPTNFVLRTIILHFLCETDSHARNMRLQEVSSTPSKSQQASYVLCTVPNSFQVDTHTVNSHRIAFCVYDGCLVED